MASHDDWSEQMKYSDHIRAGDLAFDALARVLQEADCVPTDLVDLMTYHTSYPEHMEQFMAAKSTFQGEGRPAWTAVGVEKLGMPGTLVELKATAYAPRKS